MHAPLVGDSVQVSPRPLVERIRALEAQDGIMVGRPVAGVFFGPDGDDTHPTVAPGRRP
jgi:hypothetical protein